MFYVLTSSYDSYRDNIVLVIGAVVLITAGGLAAWIISIRKGR